MLYQQGRDLLKNGKAAEACPKLAESQRLDPATGTLIALAMCHEQDGKLASAWAEFVSAESRSRSEGRADREAFCHERAEAIRPKLSTLEIRVPAATAALPGLEIRRDGVVFGSGAWNTPAPVDGGSHLIEVSATGKQSWKSSIELKPESDAQVLEVPADLPAAGASDATATAAATTAPPGTDSSQSKPWGGLEWAGVATAGAGVIALGVGGFFLSSALGENSDSEADCDGNVCGDQGTADRNSAVSDGNTATWLGIAGGVLVATGATLFIVGRNQGSSETAVSFGVGPQGFGTRFSTHF